MKESLDLNPSQTVALATSRETLKEEAQLKKSAESLERFMAQFFAASYNPQALGLFVLQQIVMVILQDLKRGK